jgi:bifunctional non-homologous end joining protein LigD
VQFPVAWTVQTDLHHCCAMLKLGRGKPAIRLAIPTRVASAFDHPDWVFELKHDGFRALSYITDGRCTLVSRKANVYKSFTLLCSALAGLRVQNAVLDGEIVCLDDEGRSQFYTLLRRRGQPVFYAFDLLWMNGEDLRQLPLVRRKERLRRLIDRNKCSSIMYAQHIPTKGTALFTQVCKWDMEGIICKRKQSPYSDPWLKVMNPDYTQHEGRHEMFTAFKGRVRATR